ncbi:MAG: DUF488 family protein [Pseudomonadota bacterium]|nr:DUF488 family protein [Pseudomonadota bacterium]
MEIRTRRIYDPPTAQDGTRILVDGLWPRGISKQQARLDGWWRELAPGKELRQWFAHDPSRWEGFKERYFAELDAKHEALSALAETSRGGWLTLLFAARDPVHNNALALRKYLLRASKRALEEIGEEPE